MKITNNTSFPVIAFGWHKERGYGADVAIRPGQSANIPGPYLGEMGGGRCYVIIPGDIVCQEKPDDADGFQILPGKQLHLDAGMTGVSVRHFSEGRGIQHNVVIKEELQTCCMCQKTDSGVKFLKTLTTVHPQCMELAALGALAEEIGWKE